MVVKYFPIFAINSLLLCLALNSQTALAGNNPPPTINISPYNLSYHATDNFEPFTVTPQVKKQRNSDIIIVNSSTSKFKSNFSENEGNIEDKVLAIVPYGDNLKHMWNVVDGDVDLHFKGLRADRGNTGITYKTSTIPLIGYVEGLQLKFEAGKEQKVSFESNKIPLIGTIEGFNFKGSISKNSRISARYTIAFD